ncbi:hypothetical protein [Methylobacterium frigidaeris]|uniref:Uncharacterized protein n=1 Tax=Methylobacterium frigidaeris TaxID=2038277 RepID=A0AA37H693_9HYPH|nr:hypothetical protein [Methylobacterium frigidaeris]GJD60228.1 hypothetical protein MPEAHAMD_0364 [Methylobacterium frigidaeris]
MIVEWSKRRREERARREAMEARRREYQWRANGAPSASASLPGNSLDTLSPLHPLSPLYGGHAAPDTSVSHSHDDGSCASDGGSSSSSDGGSSGGGCD